jgi:hypothetical protein
MGRFIQARSVSDGIGTTFDVTPCVASDPPAHAECLYGNGIPRSRSPGLRRAACESRPAGRILTVECILIVFLDGIGPRAGVAQLVER